MTFDCDKSLLPNSAHRVEHATDRTAAQTSCIDMETMTTLWNPDTCPVEFLPWLAWALSVDQWDNAWSEEAKRAVCRASLSIHKIKGTPGAVENALAAAGVTAQLQEWFEYGDEPYCFTVFVEPNPDVSLDMVRAIVDSYKNLRSWLCGGLFYGWQVGGDMYVGAAGNHSATITVEGGLGGQIIGPMYSGVAGYSDQTMTVGYQP